MTEKTGVRERIISTSMRLFYEQGIGNTGVNQIIDESKVAKASFYKYFPSKSQLERVCILEYDKYIKSKMITLVFESLSFSDFVEKWVRLIKEDMTLIYRGCPISEAGYQLDRKDRELMELLGQIMEGWHSFIKQFFEKMVLNGSLPDHLDIDKTSKRMVHLYEGAAAMWKLTNDVSYLDDLEFLMLKMVE